MDWFYGLCWLSVLVLPAWLLFRRWRKNTISFDELEMHASREEFRARQRLARAEAFERTPTLFRAGDAGVLHGVPPNTPKPGPGFHSAAPSLSPDACCGELEPHWESSAEYAERRRRALITLEDPAPVFDDLFRQAVQQASTDSVPDAIVSSTPDNDNGSSTSTPDATFDGGGGGEFGGGGSSGEW
jgi:uncharacterized membrane protein YgcG